MNLSNIRKLDLKNHLYYVFFLLVMIIPILNNKFVVGTLVNFILVTSYFKFGLKKSIVLSIFPSIFAVYFNILPIVMISVIPFIILSNFILLYSLNILKNLNFKSKIFISLFLKIIFLYAVGIFYMNFDNKLFFSLVSMHQLITALFSGILAWIFLRN